MLLSVTSNPQRSLRYGSDASITFLRLSVTQFAKNRLIRSVVGVLRREPPIVMITIHAYSPIAIIQYPIVFSMRTTFIFIPNKTIHARATSKIHGLRSKTLHSLRVTEPKRSFVQPYVVLFIQNRSSRTSLSCSYF